MEELNVFDKLSEIEQTPQFSMLFGNTNEQSQKIEEHKLWLQSIRKERPLPSHPYKVGIYIRYFNQTKYDNYLDFHKKQFVETLALCPKWSLFDFYIDNGPTAPNMENAGELCRLIEDAMNEKVDLIITQKISNVSKKAQEITFVSRILASLSHPVGIYFVSEDIFTLASYYLNDMKDTCFIPDDLKPLPDDNPKIERGLLND